MREVLFRVAERRQIPLILVANRPLVVPRSRFISTVVVGAGFDVADDHIAASCDAGDIVVTGDIPLAAAAVERGAVVIEYRGDLLDANNVKQRLAQRDRLAEARESGLDMGGPAPYGKPDIQRFSNAMDRLLTKLQPSFRVT